ncbi:hypothetical protein NPX13_g1649 [Xylaria arbuscula]|uniref:Uncharacterized protein n=1 Tax=Xylaria arbuscula TaxID=114810 RepID=A0A9W8TPX6_9PEZI|nr:hypothetical protein NPX13_g1649 [Xylaria arbuscula]
MPHSGNQQEFGDLGNKLRIYGNLADRTMDDALRGSQYATSAEALNGSGSSATLSWHETELVSGHNFEMIPSSVLRDIATLDLYDGAPCTLTQHNFIKGDHDILPTRPQELVYLVAQPYYRQIAQRAGRAGLTFIMIPTFGRSAAAHGQGWAMARTARHDAINDGSINIWPLAVVHELPKVEIIHYTTPAASGQATRGRAIPLTQSSCYLDARHETSVAAAATTTAAPLVVTRVPMMCIRTRALRKTPARLGSIYGDHSQALALITLSTEGAITEVIVMSSTNILPDLFALGTRNAETRSISTVTDIARNGLILRYGPIVRIGPNELAFSSPEAWRDIYGHKKVGEIEFPKYDGTYHLFPHLPTSVINANREDHGALRRQLSHGFSDRSMREQEPIIGSYVDLLIKRLKDITKDEPIQNLRDWYNYTTFDIIGDLSFARRGVRLSAAIRLPSMDQVDQPWASKMGILADTKHRSIVYEKVGERMKGGERPDFLEGLLRKKEELKLDQARLTMNASLLILAGSETTATLLTGATYLLATNPQALRKLEQEVRSAFKSDEEITLLSVGNLSYMLACLNESLRQYPPVAGGLPRWAPKGGAVIGGKFVPERTIVSIFQLAVNYDEHYWNEPEKFRPERWMEDSKSGDQLDAMQPFSVGPRNCIGRNLAYAEMRLILAKLVYNFDMSLAEDSREWLKGQKAYTIWDKPPLNVVMKPVVR